MDALVGYQLEDSIATITLDDGKVNVMSLQMQREINEAFDRAERDRAVVVLAGRDGVFSAGFDLSVLSAGGRDAIAMVRGGFELASRVLSFPFPVVIACTGHAIAMGTFLLLSGDHRIGTAGAYKLAANEVAIGLTMPYAAVEILRQRLSPSAFNRAVTLAETFTPENAVESGFLDQVVAAAELQTTARSVAAAATLLDLGAHAASKLRARASALAAIRAGLESDDAEA
ncbi:MAG: crotonase/enoyl-CoA hydratase family protein [Acidimicrobiia bacterium]